MSSAAHTRPVSEANAAPAVAARITPVIAAISRMRERLGRAGQGRRDIGAGAGRRRFLGTVRVLSFEQGATRPAPTGPGGPIPAQDTEKMGVRGERGRVSAGGGYGVGKRLGFPAGARPSFRE